MGKRIELTTVYRAGRKPKPKKVTPTPIVGDGVALVSARHPDGPSPKRVDIRKSAIETIEAPPAVAAAIECGLARAALVEDPVVVLGRIRAKTLARVRKFRAKMEREKET